VVSFGELDQPGHTLQLPSSANSLWHTRQKCDCK
jgi:hypothetical protein